MDPSRPPTPLNSSSCCSPSFCHPSHLRDTGGRKRGLWTCALRGPWSSDNSKSVTSAQQTGCPADDTNRQTARDSRAILGPVLPLQPSPSKERALGSLPAPGLRLSYIHSLLGRGRRAETHNKITSLLRVSTPWSIKASL